ncbi:MAG: hypothetical protein ISP55_00820 [Flavobacteriales bacterium]|jgi:uncharacterized iron-regulated membrane protein|nr:hypothetical protein [Flavobacteriales bacterium]
MNLQELITPAAKFIEWTFETVLVPISSPFNLAVIVLIVSGIALWLRRQGKFTAEARQNGGII